MQIKASPEAHKMSVAMSMIGLNVDIPSAHAMYRMLQALDKMGSKFDLLTAAKIRTETFELFDKVAKKYSEKLTKNKITNEKNKRSTRKGVKKSTSRDSKTKISNSKKTK